MNRREFLRTTASTIVAAPLLTAQTTPMKMGLNSYCLRALRWTDKQLLEYAASLKLDGIFLQDSLDPERDKPAHWKETGAYAKQLNLHLETGIGPVLPADDSQIAASRKTLLDGLERAKAFGSPLMRTLHAGDRAHLPKRTMKENQAAMVKTLRSVKSQFQDAGVKVAIENHKDLQAWEMREVIEAAGKDWVGSYLDTGNPVFVAEDPLLSVEVLGPYALCAHLRDTSIYEKESGAMVEWVPLGEGTVDFKAITAHLQQVKPDIYIYIKPITGRPPQLLPYYDAAFWADYPEAQAADFARFLALAKRGVPYEKPIVLEDLPGKIRPEFLTAVQFQQKEHMERSIAYAQKTLDLGVRWRS